MSAKLEVRPADLAPFRPWLAAVTLVMKSIVSLGFNPNDGVDQRLSQWAFANGKTVRSLESNEAQFRVFGDLTPKEDAEFMAVTLRQIEEVPQMLNEMLAAYRKGDTAALDKTVNAGLDDFPVLRERLFKARHDKWLPQIEKMIAQGGSHVIVVGTGHLVGRDSVVAMLRAKGLRIEGP